MSKLHTIIALAGMVSFDSITGAVAEDEGDAVKGMEVFNKRCKTCHIVGDAAKVSKKAGPNLTGVYGRKPGAREQYTKYGASIVELGGVVEKWDTAELVAYVQNPRKYLRAKLDNKKAKSKMSFKLSGKKRADDRANVVAYLKSLSAE